MEEQKIHELLEKCKEDQIQKIVVGAIISKDSNILLLERPEDDFMGGIFELPSGNVEQGEEIIPALKREIIEETGLQPLKIVDFLNSFDYKSGSGKNVRQLNFIVEVEEGEIKLTEHDSFSWSNLADNAFEKTTDSVKKTIQAHLNRSKE